MTFSLDPFDIEWRISDPLDRDVVMLKSIKEMRESTGKHSSSEEFLSTDEVRNLIEAPTRIDVSSSNLDRDVYYRKQEEYKNPYARAVVDFEHENAGIVVSWSRYKHPVSSSGIRWEE